MQTPKQIVQEIERLIQIKDPGICIQKIQVSFSRTIKNKPEGFHIKFIKSTSIALLELNRSYLMGSFEYVKDQDNLLERIAKEVVEAFDLKNQLENDYNSDFYF